MITTVSIVQIFLISRDDIEDPRSVSGKRPAACMKTLASTPHDRLFQSVHVGRN